MCPGFGTSRPDQWFSKTAIPRDGYGVDEEGAELLLFVFSSRASLLMTMYKQSELSADMVASFPEAFHRPCRVSGHYSKADNLGAAQASGTRYPQSEVLQIHPGWICQVHGNKIPLYARHAQVISIGTQVQRKPVATGPNQAGNACRGKGTRSLLLATSAGKKVVQSYLGNPNIRSYDYLNDTDPIPDACLTSQ